MVVSVEERATAAGVSMLERGGNAVDAAVATAFALSVTHPSAASLGGGGFALWRAGKGRARAYDFRERSPRQFGAKDLEAALASGAKGTASAAVPGLVAGLFTMHQRHGKLPLTQVLQPAIELAESGFELPPRQAQVLAWAWPQIGRQAAVVRRFGANREGPKRAGQRIVQTSLGRMLRAIAERGAAAFYSKSVAQALLKHSPHLPFDEVDFVAYRTTVLAPQRVAYRGFEVLLPPLPSAGGVSVSQMLTALERQQFAQLPVNGTTATHLFLEVDKRAQIFRRTQLGATPLASYPPLPLVPLDSSTPLKQLGWQPEGQHAAEHTTHLSTVDAENNAVSCSLTLSASFGSGLYVEPLGLFLNNSLAAFSYRGGNAPAGGKAMWSSMAPAVVSRNGKLVAVLGSPGGDTIPSTIVRVLTNLDAGMPLDAAVDAPRMHYDVLNDHVRLERRISPPPSILSGLEKLGHAVFLRAAPIGDANNIVLSGDTAFGYADPREGGLARGPSTVTSVSPAGASSTP